MKGEVTEGLGSCHQPGASSPLKPEEGGEGHGTQKAPALLPFHWSSPLPPPSGSCLCSTDQTPVELKYSQEGEFGRGGIHQATAPGAVHQVPSPL